MRFPVALLAIARHKAQGELVEDVYSVWMKVRASFVLRHDVFNVLSFPSICLRPNAFILCFSSPARVAFG